MSHARWSITRTSRSKYHRVKKFDNDPELNVLQICADLQSAKRIQSFACNKEALTIGVDANGRPIIAIPDCILVSLSGQHHVIRVMGRKWHPEGDPDDLEQKRLLELQGYEVHDVIIDGHEDWGQISRDIAEYG